MAYDRKEESARKLTGKLYGLEVESMMGGWLWAVGTAHNATSVCDKVSIKLSPGARDNQKTIRKICQLFVKKRVEVQELSRNKPVFWRHFMVAVVNDSPDSSES